MTISCIIADYKNPNHANDIITLLDSYAKDPMGGSTPLKQSVKDNLINQLSRRSYAFSVLLYVDNQAAGLANCFEGFSTFKCQPLINIHDLAVISQFHGQGLAAVILEKIEQEARQRGCCKITLEVLEGNKPAQRAYQKFGFSGYELDPTTGKALFWEKALNPISDNP